MKQIYTLLSNRSFLILLLIINIAGTVYGYDWYRWQLIDTPAIFIPFVPDSPTASLFFVFVLIAFLLGKNWPIFEALVMNLLVFQETGEVELTALMLIFSHGAMAVQGVLYAPFYRIKAWHLIVATVWTLHNDVIDYVFFMLPRYSVLSEYIPQIGYFTFWLSLFSIGLTYFLCIRKGHYQLKIPSIK